MTNPLVRFFELPKVHVFRLSPLYAEPGWYGTADMAGTVGPYPSREQLLRALETLTPARPEERS